MPVWTELGGREAGRTPSILWSWLPSRRIGALLAAVGNHEAKALTFLSMEPAVGYGVSALHHRFLDIQAPDRLSWER